MTKSSDRLDNLAFWGVAGVISVLLHGSLLGVMASRDASQTGRLDPVEIEIREVPPPPKLPALAPEPEPEPAPAPEPEPEAVKPPEPKRAPAKAKPKPKPKAKRPVVAKAEPQAKPSEEKGKERKEGAPPSFGLKLSGGTTAGIGNVALPMGDTLLADPSGPRRGNKPLAKGPSGPSAGPSGEQLVGLNMITTMPKVRERVIAEYPEELKRSGVEGRVVLEITLNAQGKVKSIRLIRGLHPQLDRSAIKAARRMTFSPALINGKAVGVKIPYTFAFVLD